MPFPFDIRPGENPDARSSMVREANYPGKGDPNSQLSPSSAPANSSIRNIRVGDVPNLGDGPLGPMELAGRVVSPPKVPTGPIRPSRPITGPGPIEMNRFAQQQRNAVIMNDPDYAPMRELDYEKASRK